MVQFLRVLGHAPRRAGERGLTVPFHEVYVCAIVWHAHYCQYLKVTRRGINHHAPGYFMPLFYYLLSRSEGVK